MGALMHRMEKKIDSEPMRCIIVYKNGYKFITNTLNLFGDPEVLQSNFRWQLLAGSFSASEFWLQKVHKYGAIYHEV
jgi:hypothetical protein